MPRLVLIVVSAVGLLGGCALRPTSTAPAPAPSGTRVAVLPFRVGGTLNPAGDFVGDAEAATESEGSLAAAQRLTAHLAALGVAVVDVDLVAGTTARAGAGRYGPVLARRVAERAGATAAVFGSLTRFEQREGTAWAVERSASVEYELMLVRADGTVLASDRFAYTQQPLTQNLLDLPRFLRGGGRWMTREEILDGALSESAEKLAAALRAGRPRPRR